ALCAPQPNASVHRFDEPEPSERKRYEEAQRDDLRQASLGGKINRNARLASERGRRRRIDLKAHIPVPHPFVGLFVDPGVTDARHVRGGERSGLARERVENDRRAFARPRPRRRHRERDRLLAHAAFLFSAPKTSCARASTSRAASPFGAASITESPLAALSA